MTLEYTKPVLPDYLVQATQEATAAMREIGNIADARRDVTVRLTETEKQIADMEAELGDREAESLLRRKPDSATAKIEEKLEALRAQQRKLVATGEALDQRSEAHDQTVVTAYANLNSARRKLGYALLPILNQALEEAARPLQDVLDVAEAINRFVDFNEFYYARMETVVSCFGGDRHLIVLGTNYTPQGERRKQADVAAQWQDALAAAKQTMSNMLSISDTSRRAIEHRQEKAAEERIREERLKPRIV